MTNGNGGLSCGLGCWALAGGAGLLAFVLLLVLGDTAFFGALFLAGVLTLVLGLLFSWVFCRDMPAAGTVTPGEDRRMHATPPPGYKGKMPPAEPQSAAPRPETVAPANASATVDSPAAEAKPEVQAAPAATDAEAGAKVQPTAALAGEAELAERKGTWRYDGASAADATPEAQAPQAAPGVKPAALSGPRDGQADDLKLIKGIGPKLEKLCHDLGFYHFDQIAAWTADEVAWVDDNLEGFKGRVTRDNWVEQAAKLAAGETPAT